jgi:hypothetical protein
LAALRELVLTTDFEIALEAKTVPAGDVGTPFVFRRVVGVAGLAGFESAATPETTDDEISGAELEFAGSGADEGFSGAYAGSALPDAASASAKLEASGDELAVGAGAIAGRVAFGLASISTSIGVPRDAMQASCQCQNS